MKFARELWSHHGGRGHEQSTPSAGEQRMGRSRHRDTRHRDRERSPTNPLCHRLARATALGPGRRRPEAGSRSSNWSDERITAGAARRPSPAVPYFLRVSALPCLAIVWFVPKLWVQGVGAQRQLLPLPVTTGAMYGASPGLGHPSPVTRHPRRHTSGSPVSPFPSRI